MNLSLIAVSSSQLKGVGYDPATKTLVIEFNAARARSVYRYEDVAPATVGLLVFAPSIGRAFGSLIKGVFQYRRLTDDEIQGIAYEAAPEWVAEIEQYRPQVEATL